VDKVLPELSSRSENESGSGDQGGGGGGSGACAGGGGHTSFLIEKISPLQGRSVMANH